jgi:hypothetical protein
MHRSHAAFFFRLLTADGSVAFDELSEVSVANLSKLSAEAVGPVKVVVDDDDVDVLGIIGFVGRERVQEPI